MNAMHNFSTTNKQRPAASRIPALITAVALAALAFMNTGCFRVSRDANALRASVAKAAEADCDEQFEIGLGSLTFGLAKAVVALVDLEPEAKAALSAVSGAEVGVYQLKPRHGKPNRSAMLVAADEAMSDRGWDRVVGVLDQGNLVAVYVPTKARSPRDLKVCVVVVDAEQMVVASARGNPEALMDLALKQAPQELKHKLGVKL